MFTYLLTYLPQKIARYEYDSTKLGTFCRLSVTDHFRWFCETIFIARSFYRKTAFIPDLH